VRAGALQPFADYVPHVDREMRCQLYQVQETFLVAHRNAAGSGAAALRGCSSMSAISPKTCTG
jgi:hypothetical protein